MLKFVWLLNREPLLTRLWELFMIGIRSEQRGLGSKWKFMQMLCEKLSQ